MKRSLLLQAAALLFPLLLVGQPEYYMTNLVVDDCEGILYDSELGDPGGNYDHNENYTFSICIPGADQIIMTFLYFCTEADFDSLRIYDGPDTLSLLIGTYTGEPDPPVIIATSGCLTLNFVSDPNVSCTGWEAHWETVVEIPPPPDILPLDDLPCESNTMTVVFAEQIPCDSLYPSAFAINGPISPTITNVQPVGCSGGYTNTVNLSFSPMIDFSGNYQVSFTNSVTICETVYTLTSTEPFAVTDCPLNVILSLEGGVACAGDTAQLTALASGGDPNTYQFSWNPPVGLNTDEVIIVPTGPTTYGVTVTDANGATASDSITIIPNPVPVLSLPDTTLCQSIAPFALTALPAGGEWSATGIAEGEELTGWYDPSLVTTAQDTVVYVDPNGCASSAIFDIVPLDPGLDEAACPGTPAFQVLEALPTGGVWSGPFVTPDGLFTPPVDEGSYELIYTHPNGCSGSKVVNVGELQLPALDTLCQSEPAFELAVTPFGGNWSGPGITDPYLGLFDPDEAGPGDHTLLYEANGCSDSISFFIKEIDAAWNFSACPLQAPFILPGNWQPMGTGIWSGAGVTDTIAGWYDPGLLPDGFNDTLTFTANGCTDQRIVYIRLTRLGVDTLAFCQSDEELLLNWETTGLVPGGGNWSGIGISHPNPDDYFFDPGQAGPGLHVLVYENNTCSDSLWARVYPNPQVQSTTVCVAAPVFQLQTNLSGGNWSGTGVVNAFNGTFDPAIAGVGTHTVYYTSPDGCGGEGAVEVTPLTMATIEGLDETYCFRDTSILPILSPAGGQLTVDGQTAAGFNPAIAGAGAHILIYTAGVNECASSTDFIVTVGEPVSLEVPFDSDTLCFGATAILTATATGGSSNGNYTYNWNQGLGFGQSHYVEPGSTTSYTVTASDGCSEPATGQIELFVHPDFELSFFTGAPVCFDDTTFAEVSVSPAGSYSYVWDSDPPTYGDYIESYPTTYVVEATNDSTGCRKEAEVELPGYDLIKANFGYSPNVSCLTTLDPTIEVLDFSVGGIDGYWDFGDGAGTPYMLGEDLTHTYADTGHYTITLYIENEGGCFSEFQQEVCVKFENHLYIPNAFSPNGDGHNDLFRMQAIGVETIEWMIFNRYGAPVFAGESIDDVWDGTHQGKRVEQGVYVIMASYTVRGSSFVRFYEGDITVLY